MPKKDGTGPPKKSFGERDGRGGGKGNNASSKGVGKKRGARKGVC